MADLLVHGGRVLAAGADEPLAADLLVKGATIRDAASEVTANTGRVIDATGALVLPGLVDVHGDAFERAIMPRGGVMVDVTDGIADNDAALLASGITTAFLSITDSWEPGLRSRATLRQLIDAVDVLGVGPDRRVHVRHERCNTEDFDELLGWIRRGVIHMISFNDHTPGGIAHVKGISPTQIGRSGVAVEHLQKLEREAIERRPLGHEQDAALAEVCGEVACVTASHDPGTMADLQRDLALGVAIAEFPITIELAQSYIDNDIEVLLGAPNLVRGGSHLGNLSVRAAIAAQAGTVLCSDYHYPSLLRAPFVLADLELCSFGRAWSMVSDAPARACGLTDRGRLEPGARADLVVVEPPTDRTGPRVRTVIVGGEVVHQVAAG